MSETFDNNGDSAAQFLEWWMQGAADLEAIQAERLPVNRFPDRVINAFAIRWPLGPFKVEGMANPNLYFVGNDAQVGVWFHAAIDPEQISARTGKPSALNLHKQVRHRYAQLLNGSIADTMPNPLTGHPAKWLGREYVLTDLRESLKAEGNWGRVTVPEFLSRGGASRSEAKQAAFEALQALRAAQADQKALRVVEAAERFEERDEIASYLGIEPDSVRKTVARAIQRVEAM